MEFQDYQLWPDEESFPSQDEFEYWKRRCYEMIEVAQRLAKAFRFSLDDEIKTLEGIVDSAEIPPERDEDEEVSIPVGESDWTIERIFEDL